MAEGYSKSSDAMEESDDDITQEHLINENLRIFGLPTEKPEDIKDDDEHTFENLPVEMRSKICEHLDIENLIKMKLLSSECCAVASLELYKQIRSLTFEFHSQSDEELQKTFLRKCPNVRSIRCINVSKTFVEYIVEFCPDLRALKIVTKPDRWHGYDKEYTTDWINDKRDERYTVDISCVYRLKKLIALSLEGCGAGLYDSWLKDLLEFGPALRMLLVDDLHVRSRGYLEETHRTERTMVSLEKLSLKGYSFVAIPRLVHQKLPCKELFFTSYQNDMLWKRQERRISVHIAWPDKLERFSTRTYRECYGDIEINVLPRREFSFIHLVGVASPQHDHSGVKRWITKKERKIKLNEWLELFSSKDTSRSDELDSYLKPMIL